MVNKEMLENALKIALDDYLIDDENVSKDEIDDVLNEFTRLCKTLKKEAKDSDEDVTEEEGGQ